MGYDAPMAKGKNNHEYVPIAPVRRNVAFLEDHYGSLLDASEAIGVPYRTLQGIRLVGKYKQVVKSTAETISQAAADPPAYKKTKLCSFCGKKLGKTVVQEHYCSMECKKGREEETWHKKFIEVEKVRPLVNFIQNLYGSMDKAAEASGIPVTTLNNIKYDSRMRGLKRETAAKLVEFVMAHKRRGTSPFASTYENEQPARFVVSDDKQYVTSGARWRSSGG